MKLYKIENNHRSTKEIIDILNFVRADPDFIQSSPENKRGNPPQILIGAFPNAYKEVVKNLGDELVCTLSYKNDISNIMKFGHEYMGDAIINEIITKEEDINEFLFKGSNGRSWRIGNTIMSIEYCKQGKIKDAIKYMKKAYRKENFGNKEALENLKRLMDRYQDYKHDSIKDFYNKYLHGHYGVSLKITRGKISNCYESKKYKQIAVNIQINDDGSFHRTIHKSKGDEFDNVLVIIPSEEDLDFLLNPDITDEKNRVYYVALSRAIENLFINIPKLSEDNKTKLNELGFEIMDLDAA